MIVPIGFASARTTAVYKRICKIPFDIMHSLSEPLRAKQGVEEIHTQKQRDDQTDKLFHETPSRLIPIA